MQASDKTLGQARELADRLTETLRASLPEQPQIVALWEAKRRRAIITAADDAGAPVVMPLLVSGEQVGSWSVALYCTLDDWEQRFLKVVKSNLAVRSVWEKTPLVRLEYDSKLQTSPASHWQFHGERGAFSHWLARAHASHSYVTASPHSLSTLHFPTGGVRMRPAIEDFIEFLIKECGVDHMPEWQNAVSDGRDIWRRMQFRALVGDLQEEAAERLKDLGWAVAPPPGHEPYVRERTLRDW